MAIAVAVACPKANQSTANRPAKTITPTAKLSHAHPTPSEFHPATIDTNRDLSHPHRAMPISCSNRSQRYSVEPRSALAEHHQACGEPGPCSVSVP